MSSDDLSDLGKEFFNLRSKCEQQAQDYEKLEYWEMAYISYWSILETGLKLFATTSLRKQLHDKIKNWNDYLTGVNNIKPNKITNFSVQYASHNIPKIKDIEIVLGTLPNVARIIDSSGKWRKKRNDIAHNANRFKDKILFLEYKQDIIGAIEELNKNIENVCRPAK